MTTFLEAVQAMIEEGFKITTVITLLLLWRKHQSSKRMRDDIEAIKKAVVTWDAEKSELSLSTERKSLISSWAAKLYAPIADASIVRESTTYLKKGTPKMKKFTSRKFILAVSGAILIILNDGLDLGIDSDTVLAFAGLLATWIVGESAVDAKRASKSMDAPGDTGPAE